MPNPRFNGLPLQLTSFIGRDREIAAVRQLLASLGSPQPGTLEQASAARLLTLTGVGGCGKTRLALEVAHTCTQPSANGAQRVFADGVHWVELAPLADPELLPQTVAAVLGLRERAGRPPHDALIDALRPQHMLLILDNCEHLAAACAGLAQVLLAECPNVVLLATSRAPLHVAGEVVFPVPPLETVNLDPQTPATNLMQSEAVQLFLDRARTLHFGFTLHEQDERAVNEICQRLDGIALAIELAAARTTLLTPQQIARRLDDVFNLLRSANPTVVPRHQSLRAAFTWSHSLLTEQEQILFRRLAVFKGGWTLDAAEYVVSGGVVAASDVLDLHQRLLDHSLIVRTDDGRRERARYRQLEPVRQLAQELIEQAGEAPPVQDRHLEYFTWLAEKSWEGILTPDYTRWLDRMFLEIDNIRAALSWAMHGGTIELGMRLAVALFHFWLERHHLGESIEIYQQLVSHSAALPSRACAKVWAFLSLSHLRVGDCEQALTAANQALAMEQELPDPLIRAYALAALGHARALQGDYAEAFPILEDSLALFRAAGYVPGQGWTLSRLGATALHAGDFQRAEAAMAEATELMRESGNLLYMDYCLRHWGYALLHQGDIAGAVSRLSDEIDLTGTDGAYPATLTAVAAAAQARGLAQQAAQLLGTVEETIRSSHVVLLPYDQAMFSQTIGRVRGQLGEIVYLQAMDTGRSMPVEDAVRDALTLTELIRNDASRRQCNPAGLTGREVEVLRLVAEGLTNQEIASRLVVSPRTIHAHLRSIFGKLEVSTRTAAAHEAVRLKLA